MEEESEVARPLESMRDPKEPSAEERRSHTLATAGVPVGNVELRRSLWTTASLAPRAKSES